MLARTCPGALFASWIKDSKQIVVNQAGGYVSITVLGVMILMDIVCVLCVTRASSNFIIELPISPTASDGTPLTQIGNNFQVDVVVRSPGSATWSSPLPKDLLDYVVGVYVLLLLTVVFQYT